MSAELIAAIKLNPRPAYKIANEAGLHPTTLSKLMIGAERVAPDDRRVLAVARVLGLCPEECFDEAPPELQTAGGR